MKNVTIEKPTVEEAIAAALEELNAEDSEVEIEIINEPSKGFWPRQQGCKGKSYPYQWS